MLSDCAVNLGFTQGNKIHDLHGSERNEVYFIFEFPGPEILREIFSYLIQGYY
jgi:hypothetical protein